MYPCDVIRYNIEYLHTYHFQIFIDSGSLESVVATYSNIKKFSQDLGIQQHSNFRVKEYTFRLHCYGTKWFIRPTGSLLGRLEFTSILNHSLVKSRRNNAIAFFPIIWATEWLEMNRPTLSKCPSKLPGLSA